MHSTVSFVLLLIISLASAAPMDSLMTDFLVPCESALCSESEVASFMQEVETLIPSTNIYFIQVWAHEVTLLLCSETTMLAELNEFELNSTASITNIRPSNHCAMYESL
mmetsp:Transcript_13886/g.17464  ORF Transcript_13886/g.17464 Transcript_13886/m.17464 type:complete len:109 (-) Transcript_13886:59-385(-)